MSRYIDAEVLFDELEHTPFYNNADKEAMKAMILSLPSADVAPVVHGRWIIKQKGKWTSSFSCNVCGRCVVVPCIGDLAEMCVCLLFIHAATAALGWTWSRNRRNRDVDCNTK